MREGLDLAAADVRTVRMVVSGALGAAAGAQRRALPSYAMQYEHFVSWHAVTSPHLVLFMAPLPSTLAPPSLPILPPASTTPCDPSSLASTSRQLRALQTVKDTSHVVSCLARKQIWGQISAVSPGRARLHLSTTHARKIPRTNCLDHDTHKLVRPHTTDRVSAALRAPLLVLPPTASAAACVPTHETQAGEPRYKSKYHAVRPFRTLGSLLGRPFALENCRRNAPGRRPNDDADRRKYADAGGRRDRHRHRHTEGRDKHRVEGRKRREAGRQEGGIRRQAEWG